MINWVHKPELRSSGGYDNVQMLLEWNNIAFNFRMRMQLKLEHNHTIVSSNDYTYISTFSDYILEISVTLIFRVMYTLKKFACLTIRGISTDNRHEATVKWAVSGKV